MSDLTSAAFEERYVVEEAIYTFTVCVKSMLRVGASSIQ